MRILYLFTGNLDKISVLFSTTVYCVRELEITVAVFTCLSENRINTLPLIKQEDIYFNQLLKFNCTKVLALAFALNTFEPNFLVL